MESQNVRSLYLNHVNDSLDITPYGDGFLVWVPLTYTDDDAVCLGLEPSEGGWVVTDHGATMGRLLDVDVAVEGRTFREQWAHLARPGHGFVPNDREVAEGTILAWCTTRDIPATLHAVAAASLRAEALRYVGSRAERLNFRGRVVEHLRHLVPQVGSGVHLETGPRAEIELAHNRARRVTAVLRSDRGSMVAIQALGGSSKEARLDAADRAYGTFGPSLLPKGSRISVVAGRPEVWDSGLLQTLRDVSTVAFYDRGGDVREAVTESLALV